VRHRLAPTLLAFLAPLALAACGGDDAAPGPGGATVAPPAAQVTVQERLELAAFEAEAAADAELAALAGRLTLAHAGRLEDSAGRAVLWAEGQLSDGSTATALRHCAAGADGAADCVRVLQRLGAAGLAWEDAAGAAVAVRPVGAPVLLKNLTTHELDAPTVIALGLSGEPGETGATAELGATLDPAALPAIDFAKRRLVALNTFGDAFDAGLGEVTAAAAAHGGFHEVVEVQYAREADVAEALRGLDALDVVVWLSQGVRDETKGGGLEYRTVGLTVNRGGFGDRTMDRDALLALWDDNVAGGPGIIFLAASNSYSDGTAPQPDSGSLWTKLEGTDRLLVGVQGHADVNRIRAAAAAFLGATLDGVTPLPDAIAAGDAALAGSGASLRVNRFDPAGETTLKSYASLWDSAPFAPSAARMTAYITAVTYCGPVGQARTPRQEDFATAWAEVTFDGAYFSGRRVLTAGGLDVDTTIEGLITGWGVGDRVYLETYGNMDKAQFTEFHAFGEGIIREVVAKDDGTVEVRFNGAAQAAPYVNDLGESCVLNNPQLSTTTSKLSTLLLTP
jgi:hypothetical protein